MSRELDTPRPTQPVARSNWTELAAETAHNPTLLVPKACRDALMRLWMCNAHFFPQSVALAATLRNYLDTTEVTPDQMNAILDRLLTPERRAKHHFAADLMTDLAALVADQAKANKARAATLAARKENDQFKATRQTILDTLNGIGCCDE